jgi:dienelactone hydrolase
VSFPAPQSIVYPLDLTDTSRPEVSNGTVVASVRHLPTTVYLPASADGQAIGSSLPWVVFLHGFDVEPGRYDALLRTWARAGVAVVAPLLPLTSSASGAALDEADIVNEPADVSFLITTLLTQSARSGSVLSGRLDRTRIGVAGHSDGADVAFVVGFGDAHRDGRVKAVLDLSGELPEGEDRYTKPRPGPPMLLLLGDHDEYVPLANAQAAYDAVCCHKIWAVLLGAPHLPPFSQSTPWTASVDHLTTDFLLAMVAGDAAAGQRLPADLAVPGLVHLQASAS